MRPSRNCAAIVCGCFVRVRATMDRVADFSRHRRLKEQLGMTKWVYSFGAGHTEGRADMKNLLGGKGANLAEMAAHRPAGAARLHHHHRGLHRLLRQQAGTTPPSSTDQVARRPRPRRAGHGHALRRCATKPLLVSVRSGARVSMPGMMDTVLNLGLNDTTVARPRRRRRRSPLRLGLLSPLHPDVRRASCSASITTGSRTSSSRPSWTPA